MEEQAVVSGDTVEANTDGATNPAQEELSPIQADILSQRDRALMENSAYKRILEAHGISAQVLDSNMTSMKVEGGRVVGDYQYEAPKIQAPPPKGPTGGVNDSALTIDQVKTMSTEEINSRWDEVSTVLKNSRS